MRTLPQKTPGPERGRRRWIVKASQWPARERSGSAARQPREKSSKLDPEHLQGRPQTPLAAAAGAAAVFAWCALPSYRLGSHRKLDPLIGALGSRQGRHRRGNRNSCLRGPLKSVDMGPKKGEDLNAAKRKQAAAKKAAEDKTFGLKNKNKSKKVQQYAEGIVSRRGSSVLVK